MSAASAADPRDVAAAIAREMLAPPPLGDLPDGTMLAVAAVPGKLYAEAVLTNDKPTATLTTGAAGPYQLMVSGHFKEAGRSDADRDQVYGDDGQHENGEPAGQGP